MAEDLRFADEEPRGREAAFDAAPLSVIWPLLGRQGHGLVEQHAHLGRVLGGTSLDRIPLHEITRNRRLRPRCFVEAAVDVDRGVAVDGGERRSGGGLCFGLCVERRGDQEKTDGGRDALHHADQNLISVWKNSVRFDALNEFGTPLPSSEAQSRSTSTRSAVAIRYETPVITRV